MHASLPLSSHQTNRTKLNRPPSFLHARRDKLALQLGIVIPATSQRLAAGLLGELLHAGLELGAEVADQTLDGPGEGLAKGCTAEVY